MPFKYKGPDHMLDYTIRNADYSYMRCQQSFTFQPNLSWFTQDAKMSFEPLLCVYRWIIC